MFWVVLAMGRHLVVLIPPRCFSSVVHYCRTRLTIAPEHQSRSPPLVSSSLCPLSHAYPPFFALHRSSSSSGDSRGRFLLLHIVCVHGLYLINLRAAKQLSGGAKQPRWRLARRRVPPAEEVPLPVPRCPRRRRRFRSRRPCRSRPPNTRGKGSATAGAGGADECRRSRIV